MIEDHGQGPTGPWRIANDNSPDATGRKQDMSFEAGAQVAEYSLRSDRVALATVARLTKTQVVLDNGARYDRATLRKVGGNYGDDLTTMDDPSVRRVLAREAIRRLFLEAHLIEKGCRNNPLTLIGAREALEAVERAVIIARQALADQGA